MSCYIAIDLKSFYASVECADRGLDPLSTNLVVADPTRSDRTICLAVSPSLKAHGIPARPRLYEVIARVSAINARRRAAAGTALQEHVYDDRRIRADPQLALDYIVAPPRMQRYLELSDSIAQIYLDFVAPEDLHIYSVDEVLIDASGYLSNTLSARDLTTCMLRRVLKKTGITATAGIGTNLFLAKVAMDIVAKHAQPDAQGVRIAELDEYSYRRLLWPHRPIRDFWRVGPGYERKLYVHGLYTMGDIARCSLGKPWEPWNEDLLFRLFGINAELLIDHAWGYEPCTMADIKAYRPRDNALGSGQVLPRPYPYAQARLIVREMTEQLSLRLVAGRLLSDQLTLTVVYERGGYAHGSAALSATSSTRRLIAAADGIYVRIADETREVRRVYLNLGHVRPEGFFRDTPEQLSLFPPDPEAAAEALRLARERRQQEAVLAIRHRFGKNAILRGTNFLDGAMQRERNAQIGGHRA